MVGDVGSFEGGEIELGEMKLYLQSVNIKGDFGANEMMCEGIMQFGVRNKIIV